jgi:hypothetical protein
MKHEELLLLTDEFMGNLLSQYQKFLDGVSKLLRFRKPHQ